MEGELAVHQSKAGAAAAAALTKLTPELLLLGLRLLSKTTSAAGKTPCAVVQPRPRDIPAANGGSPNSPDSSSLLKALGSPPSSPELNQQVPRCGGRKRKRGEGEELSEEQKREKRKLMNRIAAQNARDRKKNFVEDLEKRVAELEAKNQRLQRENKDLREKTDTLVLHKQQLETRLFQQQPSHTLHHSSTATAGSVLQSEGSPSGSGSAVPFTSLQQKQVLEALLARVLVTVNLILCFTSCKTTTGLKMTSSPLVDHMIHWVMSGASHMIWTSHGEPIRKQSWWGPQQSTWNPIAI